MSHLRLNPLTGRWVTIVADRAERPTDFAPRTEQGERARHRVVETFAYDVLARQLSDAIDRSVAVGP